MLALFSTCIFGQNENPYSQFGYEAPIMPDKKPSLENSSFFIIPNSDTSSSISFLLIDISQRQISLHSNSGEIIETDTLLSYTLARWLTPDPAHQFHSPYLGMGNNPMNGVDPDGRDWFKNQDGTVKWFDNSSVGFSDADRNSWSNVGTEYMEFNGKNLKFYWQTGNEFDGYKVFSVKYKAVAGKPLADGTFDYSKARQAVPDEGPIAEGLYWVDPKQIQYYNDMGSWDQFKSHFGGSAWPGGTDSWGNERVWIYPQKVSILDPQTGKYVTRGYWTIHGGSTPGSRGCIDLTNSATLFFNRLSNAQSPRVYLNVYY